MARLMVCPNCGAPLPAAVTQAAFIRCTFCYATSNVESREVTLREEVSQELNAGANVFAQRDYAREQFQVALQSLNGTEPISYSTFRELCERHLQVFGQTESVARVAYNLALDYETDNGHALRTRGETLAYLAFGYLDTVQQLRAKPRHQLNLPFLFNTAEGPKHYERNLDVATIIALSERDPEQREKPPTVVTPSGHDTQIQEGDKPAPPRGFWSKLFG